MKLKPLGMMFEFRRCNRHELICREGEKGEGFFIIAKGSVSVSALGTDKKELQLNVLKSGDWFGEIGLIEKTHRTATVRSLQPCLLLYLSSDRFENFLKICPEVRASGYFDHLIKQRTANSLKTLPMFSCLRRKQIGPLQQFDDSKLVLVLYINSFLFSI